jgi:DNA-directed RNA polymerase subunit beta'
MSKELPSPSKISLVLDIPYKQVEEVIYFVNHIVLSAANSTIFKDKDIIDLTSPQTSKIDRQRLIRVLKEIKAKAPKDSIDYKRADEYYKTLKNTAMPFSIEQVFNFVHKHTNIRFGIGAEAIHELLRNVDLQKESINIQNEMIKLDPNSARFRKLMRRLEVIR